MGTVLNHPATEMTEGWFDHGDACLDVPLYVVKGWSWMMTENIYLNISQKPLSHEYIQHQTLIYGRYSC